MLPHALPVVKGVVVLIDRIDAKIKFRLASARGASARRLSLYLSRYEENETSDQGTARGSVCRTLVGGAQLLGEVQKTSKSFVPLLGTFEFDVVLLCGFRQSFGCDRNDIPRSQIARRFFTLFPLFFLIF